MPGDKIQVKAGVLYVNDQPAYVSPSSQIDYNVPTNGKPISADYLNQQLQINVSDGLSDLPPDSGCIVLNMTPGEKQKVEQFLGVKCNIALYKITGDQNNDLTQHTFPYDSASSNWS